QGFQEIFRVLKPTGALILTVPYVHSWDKSLIKVETQGEKDLFLTEPEYHAEHTLVYRIYGRDLHKLLRDIGFTVGYFEYSRWSDAISYQNIIVAVKSPFIDPSRFI